MKDDEIDRFARYFGLLNSYVFVLFPEKQWMHYCSTQLSHELRPYVEPLKKDKDTYHIKSPLLFFKEVFSRKQITHFLLSVPTLFDFDVVNEMHAVLVTIVWQADKEKPTVFYLDSNNDSLYNNGHLLLSPALYLFFKTMDEALAPEKCA